MARQTLGLAHELSSQRPDQGSGPRSSCGQSLGGREPPYLFLDPVDRLDTGHRRRAELGRLAVVIVEYLATQMGQAGGFSNGAAPVDLIVAGDMFSRTYHWLCCGRPYVTAAGERFVSPA